MIHYTCDGCRRSIDTDDEVRYVVRMEVYAAFDACDEESDPGRDNLQEIDDILDALDDLENDAIGSDIFQQVRYDLCSECRKQFLRNPLGRLASRNVGFSNN
jgi:hypothetical protein